MEALYRLGEGAVADVEKVLAEPTSYDAVRLTLVSLEEKGHVKHFRDGRRYIYRPSVPLRAASRSAVRRLLRTYFRGSASKAIVALLDGADEELSEKELDEIAELIRQARERS